MKPEPRLPSALVASGATPIKNWRLAGEQAFPGVKQVADGDAVIRLQTRKYGCANCPIACGGICDVSSGKYPVGEVHKPEYETIGAFGPLCLCDDLETIIKLNDMCNRSGLDTISSGHVLAFAMECFEQGILTAADTDGIHITWGNGPAMVALLDKVIRREGIGDLLADGVSGREPDRPNAAACAMHVGPGTRATQRLFLQPRDRLCVRHPAGTRPRPWRVSMAAPEPTPPIPNCASTSSSATPTRAKAP
jgi:aldehyde:ferredoxin oxidoreductase